ncbi:MAG: metallophosphoesterase family protein [Cyanobacteria bacterium P01_G01_bin.49]
MQTPSITPTTTTTLLTAPFLQLPTETSVKVVWFTEFSGTDHKIIYGENLDKVVLANTTKLSRIREDEGSKVTPTYSQIIRRDIWRHEGEVTGLTPGIKVPYQVSSITQDKVDRNIIKSDVFTLTPLPKPNTPLKILLTSDHQLMPMVAANLQKVVETIGQVDGIFFAGDLVNIADRASEWFDDKRGGAFFPCLQGKANYQLEKAETTTVYQGGELIQYAPLFPTIGNHEVMGKFSENNPLNQQFTDTVPRQVAERIYLDNANNHQDKRNWIKNNSFNTDTYEEIFSWPQKTVNNQNYYAITFGDIRLVVLQVTNIWRSPSLEPKVKGRYQEAQRDLKKPENWGYGQHIFEPINQGSLQYQWLEKELNSDVFKQAKYKIVMFHHPVHTLGGNIVPPYTNPLATIEYDDEQEIKAVRYEYPKEDDYIIRDLMPLLETAKVDLVFFGHSHLWNRFISPQGINFLESSNVGNSYGAHFTENKRSIPPDYSNLNYVEIGDPNGLKPIIPNLNPLKDQDGNALPYIASNDITVFSILDTQKGSISSYRFDTRKPNSDVVKFDEFKILRDF